MSIAVTFVIPAYRTAATLGRTLNSVRRQHVRDWEAIVVDDGSGDRTVAVARHWCARDARIHLIEAPHGGASAARNRGIAEARGEWIVFLDSDDTIRRDFLSHLLGAARRAASRPDVVVCGYDRVDPQGRVTAKVPPLPIDRAPLLVCASGPPGAIHSFLVRRARLMELGGFDEALPTNEDWDLWLRIAQSGARFAVIDRRLATYWSSPGSLSRNGPRMLTDGRVVMERARAVAAPPVPGLEIFDHGSYTTDDLSLRNAFWSAGVAIGQGGTAAELLPAIPPGAQAVTQLTHLNEKFLDGLVVGSSVPPTGLIARWPALRPRVAAFVDGAMARIGSASGGDSLMRAFDVMIARNGVFSGSQVLGQVEALSLRPRHLWRGHVPAPSCDALVMRAAWLRPATYFSFAAPVFGPLTRRDICAVICRSVVHRATARLRAHRHGPALLARIGRALAMSCRTIGRGWPVARVHPVLSAARARVADIAAGQAGPTTRTPTPDAVPHPGTGSSAAEWDRFFATEDPWNYGSPYEQLKYRRTLDLLPIIPGARALELACAEGRFTQMLAPRVEMLVAADISETAIARARARAAQFGHVEFRQHDLFSDPVPKGFDLITCSEVLYFAPSRARLDWLAGEIADALNPGGYFAHAHAYEVGDSPGRTAFDWQDMAGAATIHAAFAARPELALRRTIETDLYRIDLFQRVAPAAAPPAPVVEHVPVGAPVAPDVAGDIVWNGAILTRTAARLRRSYVVPALKLAGRDAATLDPTLRFLRRRGFSSVTPANWAAGAARAGSLRGRPLLLLADDPGEGGRRMLWDAVRGNGFGLHLIVKSDAGPAELDRCIAEGMTIASGLTSGVAGDDLDLDALLVEAVTSRLTLERRYGVRIDTACPPLNVSNTFVEQVFASAGYQRLFVMGEGMAPVLGQEMATPVTAVPIGMSLDALAALLGPEVAPPDAGDLR